MKRRNLVPELLFVLVLSLGYYTVDRFETPKYIRIVKQVEKKAVMIEVPTVVVQTVLTISDQGMEIHAETATVTFLGSGAIISPVGHILTCAHLFNNGKTKSITVIDIKGLKQPGTLLYMDNKRDLALVKINGTYDPVKVSGQTPVNGQEVIAVGNPEGLDFTVTHGIVSRIDRDLEEGFLFTQTDAPINGGNSGGPLFDLHGDLVGINARKYRNSDGLGFAISIKTINEFLELFKGLEHA